MVYAAEHDTPEKRREYDRLRKRDYREIRGLGLRGKRFVGIDGEGGNDAEGHHQYYLLTAGPFKIATGKPLTPVECLDFIASLPPDAYYVGYFFDYDVTMILRKLPAEKIVRLLDRESRTKEVTPGRGFTFPIDWHGFQIDYLPHKEFKVRKATGRLNAKGNREFSKWVVINDVGTFFQCSFIKALTLWEIGTPEEMQIIGEGKEMRADFGQLTKDIIEYNALEIDLLQKLMDAFREVCEDIGYVPARWQGPGNLATAMLKHHGVPKSALLDIPGDVLQAARDAYYGGRFETTLAGTATGPIFAYDINSAYPDALTRLPCLLHGEWEVIHPSLVETMADDGEGPLYYLAHGHYEPNKPPPPIDKKPDPYGLESPNDIGIAGHADRIREIQYPALYNFPHRSKNGRIFYPSAGSGWYWNVEIDQAAHQTFTPDAVYLYRKMCDCTPFDWVQSVYDRRIELGKSAKGMVIKLGLNSLYGKMAQSIGAAPYANPIWAGLITALTRAKLSSISHTALVKSKYYPHKQECLCSHVFMLATDAVFTDVRLHIIKSGPNGGIQGTRRIIPSKLLGDWDLKTHPQLHIIQPGLYFLADSDFAKVDPKTRGVPRQLVVDNEHKFRDTFDRLFAKEIELGEAKVVIPLKQFIGIKIASHRGRLDLAGEWLWSGVDVNDPDTPPTSTMKCPKGKGKAVSYDWGSKRNVKAVRLYNGGEQHPPIRTMPYNYDAGESTPYSKDIGKMLESAKLDGGFIDQPDWADNLKDDDM
jgi:hypothetical protein